MQLRALPAFADNYIWALADESGRALFVDPGEAAPVLAVIADGLQPAGVLLTHHHHDHIGGTRELLAHWPDLPVIAPVDERIPHASRRVGDGERVDVASWTFEVLEIPGHTRSHIAFHGHGLVFCGDTLFSLGCGRMFEGTPAQMHASLSRLSALPSTTQVCCGHEYTLANAAFALTVDPGNTDLLRRAAEARSQLDQGQPTLPATLASERACNPFLRTDAPAIGAAVARRLGREPHDAVETFAELRRWKDGFTA
ncbi:hydroxyacylglutathione hydrolase [Lysobacter daejeonensis GH1-9]|uniref:Hydroxyacylglutathione hydrolase n=1 Tax=Lysobacter daejeonensis GH1-9 TaxID=1385517 RepID=A0A0A0EX17_9GAMM|nr:hydroxyacylglutathione hydrolase [Lysobacter daejeonensis]KGM55476.1 hydroxyacylglutathione hydrolase [Lysobacter daejeonensis GH1-9]